MKAQGISTLLASAIVSVLLVPASGAQGEGRQSQHWAARTENAQEIPVKVVRAVVGGNSAQLESGEIVLRNESEADVKHWGLKITFWFSDGSRLNSYVFWPCPPGQFPPGGKVYPEVGKVSLEGLQKLSIVDASVRVIYAELYDGRQYGEDEDGVLAGVRARWWVAAAEKKRLLAVHREKGELALIEALTATGTATEHPGLMPLRASWVRVYREKGLEALLELLNRPAELIGPMIVNRLQK